MGKEGGKPAWPKPSRRYRTVTGRRYGRRYAYVGFTPSSNSQVRDEHQRDEDCKRLELEDIQKANSLCMCISLCPFNCKLRYWGVEGKGTWRKCEGKMVTT